MAEVKDKNDSLIKAQNEENTLPTKETIEQEKSSWRPARPHTLHITSFTNLFIIELLIIIIAFNSKSLDPVSYPLLFLT